MRILFITSTRIGDAVLSSGLVRHFVETYPEAKLTIACGPLPAVLFKNVPNLERIHVMTKRRGGGHWLSLWMHTVGKAWDIVVDLRSSALSFLVPTKRRHILRKSAGHRVEVASRVIGLEEPVAPYIYAGSKERRQAEAIVGQAPFWAIGPTANWVGKTWPADHFAQLVERLGAPSQPLHEAKILVLGAAHERHTIEPLLRFIPKDKLIDQVGKVDLLTVYACLERASFYVGNDSGLMHLAAAAGVPTLGLFGPSDEALYGPWGPHAATVRGPDTFAQMTRGDFQFDGTICHMVDLSVDKVEQAALSLLQQRSAQTD